MNLPPIQYVDNLIDEHYQDYIYNFLCNQYNPELTFPMWFIKGLTSQEESRRNYKEMGFTSEFFNSQKGGINPYSPASIMLFYPLFKLMEFNQMVLTNFHQGRVFIQLPGKEKAEYEPHHDLNFFHYAAIYYVNDTDGDTLFYDNDKKTIIKRISPKKGRMCFFRGDIYHGASSTTQNERIIINYNFDSKFINEFN